MLVLLSLGSCFKRRSQRCPMPWRVNVLQEVGLVLLSGGDLASKAAELGFTTSLIQGTQHGQLHCAVFAGRASGITCSKVGQVATAVFAGRCPCTAGDWLFPGRALNCISIGCLLHCLMDEGSVSPQHLHNRISALAVSITAS